MATKISAISNAFLLIGDKTINSLDEDSRRATVAANLYDSIYQTELVSHPWTFARKMQSLALTTETPVTDEWKLIYQLPSDLISVYRVYPRSDYEIYGDKIYSNTNNLTLDYFARVDESAWPPYFEKLMHFALAKDFAIPIRENASLAQYLDGLYIGQGQKSRAVDSKQRPQRQIQSKPFIEARYTQG